MTVNTFDPSQTTTLDAPAKSLASQSLIASSKGNTIGFVSLGCPKNLVDSERILTQLRMEGYNIVPTYNDADMVIVNTC
ncbi:MAG TPA: 30S ribosomal protein S12 methylthiotransferase RimO, partial [Cellvibrio sp.]